MTAMTTDPHVSPTPDPAAPGRLVADAVSLGYGDRTVVDGLSLVVPDGAVTAVVGANACGKSTLLRGMARLLRPTSRRRAARRRADPPRSPPGRWPGPSVCCRRRRSPRRASASSTWSRAGGTRTTGRCVAGAPRTTPPSPRRCALTDTTDLADRDVDELSGGQRQRVWVAMALAQGTDLLLLDEPTTYLDVAHQMELLELLRDLNAARGTTIVMVLHELNLAARFADHLVAMRDGPHRRGRNARPRS